jgi:hypothetical protein
MREKVPARNIRPAYHQWCAAVLVSRPERMLRRLNDASCRRIRTSGKGNRSMVEVTGSSVVHGHGTLTKILLKSTLMVLGWQPRLFMIMSISAFYSMLLAKNAEKHR